MTVRYLLPCACGRKVEVDSTQAGLSVACGCGASVAVPTLRGLAVLERAGGGPARPESGWSPVHGATLVAALVTLAALGGAAVAWQRSQVLHEDRKEWVDTEAIRADVERMRPTMLQDVWRRLRAGLDPRPYGIVGEIAEQSAVSQSWFYVALAIAAVAGLAAAAGLVRILTAPPAARRAPTMLK